MEPIVDIFVFFVLVYLVPVLPACMAAMFMKAPNPGWRMTIGAVLLGCDITVAAYMYWRLYLSVRLDEDLSGKVGLSVSYVAYVSTVILLLLWVIKSHRRQASDGR